MFALKGIYLFILSPFATVARCVLLVQKKRTASTNGEKDAIHGCSITQLPQSTKRGTAGERCYNRTNAPELQPHKHGMRKWMPLVHKYPIA